MRIVFQPSLWMFLALAPPQASAAPRDLDNCKASLILTGIVSRGSAECNPAWLDRPGSVNVVEMARNCNTIAGVKALTAQGMREFEGKLKSLGKDAACEEIDKLISELE